MADVREDWKVDVLNHWNAEQLETALNAASHLPSSWGQLEQEARSRYPNLTFSTDSFLPLGGHPFAEVAARRMLMWFETLKRFKCCFDGQGQRT